jgi:hypothetical protein
MALTKVTYAMIEGASVNVFDYGAVGDGTTDDSAAIQAATTAAAAINAAVVFSGGTYKLQSFISLPSNTYWIGQGNAKIFLSPTMTTGTSFGGAARAIYGRIASNIKLENIEFYSTNVGVTKVISIAFDQVTGLQIKNCVFRDFGDAVYAAQGVVIFDSSEIIITDSVFDSCTSDGAALSNDCFNFRVYDNQFTNNGDWGFAVTINCNDGVIANNLILNNTSTGTGSDRCQNIAFIGNNIQNNEHGIRVTEFATDAFENKNIVITGNNIINSDVAGISIEKTVATGNVSITGNTINGSNNHGIRVVDGVNVAISGNAIFSCTADGILFSALTAGFTTGTSAISGNKINTCVVGIRQVQTSGTSSLITLVGNNISNASTAPIATILADYIDGNLSTNYFSFSKTLSFPTALKNLTANAGGVAIPATVWGYLPVYFDGGLKKIPVFEA